MKKTAYIRSASAAAVIGLTLSLGGVTAVAQDDVLVPAAPPHLSLMRMPG